MNLAQGIEDRGIAKGKEIGKESRNVEIVLKMNKKGYTSEQISEIVDKSVEDVEAIIATGEPVYS